MTESLTVSLFISIFCVLHLPLRDCFHREKDVWVGGYVTVICPYENTVTDFRQTRTPQE